MSQTTSESIRPGVFKPKALPWVLILALSLVSLTSELHAEVFNLTESGGNRSLRLNIPDSIGSRTVRGILICGNGAGGTVLNKATDPELVAFASRLDFAVLATGFWANFSQTDDSELLLFESMISDFAATSGHPELVNAPWLPTGFSNGGQMSFGLASKRPAQVIAFITSKGCCYNTFTPSEATRRIPAILIAGENDTAIRRDNISMLYTNNRPLGALWSWVEEEATGHSLHNENHLKLPFLAEACRLRYPADQSPANGPVILNQLDETSGWLVDQSTWETGFTEIFAYSDIASDSSDSPLNYGWVLNEKIAVLYRGFSSRLKATQDITTTSSPLDISSTIQYAPELANGLTWSKIEAFVNNTPIGSVLPGELVSWQIDFTYGGMHTFHAVVTLPNGEKRASYLNRVFVDGQLPQTTFDNWLNENYPPVLQDPLATPEPDGIPLITRFALNLDSAPENQPSILTPIANTPATLQFTQRSDIESSGVQIEVQATTDLLSEEWTTIPSSDPSYSIQDDLVSIDLSAGNHSARFARLRITRSE